MPFQFLHKCNANDPGEASSDYAMMLGTGPNGQEMTRVQCPKCREGFDIVGGETFRAAQPASDRNRALGRPGFITHGRVQ